MSNIIYNNYVYLITQISTNKKYIGVRTSKNNIHPENDLGKFYFGSSKVNGIRKKDQKLNYSDYIYMKFYTYHNIEKMQKMKKNDYMRN